MGKTRANYNWKNTGFPVVYDKTTTEAIVPMFPIVFIEDFLGDAGGGPFDGTTVWNVVETALNTAIAVVANTTNGVVQITLDSDDNAEIGCLHWGDQLSLSLNQGLILEARLCLHVLPTTGTATSQVVFGLASAHNADLDAVATRAWFRVESAANTALLWEVDDNITADEDNDASTVLVADAYHIYRIDATDTSAVKFYVDGVLVGTGSMAGLTGVIDKVQPYFNVSKETTGTSTGVGTMYIDYVKIFQDRS